MPLKTEPAALSSHLLDCHVLIQDGGVPEGEVVLSHENKSPIQDTFQFQRITGGITRCGQCSTAMLLQTICRQHPTQI